MKYKEWLNDWLELYEKESVKPRTYSKVAISLIITATFYCTNFVPTFAL